MLKVKRSSVSLKGQNGLDDILEKCAALMAKKGYHGTSMRDLAVVTERSLSGLYHYFNSKEDLLFLINERGFSSLLENAQTISKSWSSKEQLKKAIFDHIEFFSRHMNEMKIMMFGTQSIDKKQSKLINKLKDDYANEIKSIVSSYMHDSSNDVFSDAEVSRRTYLLFGMMNWIYGWYSKSEHGSSEALAQDIFNTFTQGCSIKSEQTE